MGGLAVRINEIMPLLLPELSGESKIHRQGYIINDILRCLIKVGTSVKGWCLTASSPDEYIKQNVPALEEWPALSLIWILTTCTGFLRAEDIAKSVAPKDINCPPCLVTLTCSCLSSLPLFVELIQAIPLQPLPRQPRQQEAKQPQQQKKQR